MLPHRGSAGGLAVLAGRRMAGVTGLEPAASGVTGRRSNQLSYTPDAGEKTARKVGGS